MILLNQQTGIVYRIEKELIIGRNPDCGIMLIDGKVSRHHAKIYMEGDKCLVQDLGSKNGTFVNDERITRPTEISPGANIRVGRAVFVLRPGEGELQAVPSFSDEAWRSRTTLSHASIDPAQYDLTHEATRISDHAEGTWLKKRLAAITNTNRILRDLTHTEQIEDAVVRELLNVFPVAKRCLIVYRAAPGGNLVIRAFRSRPDSDSSRIGTSRTIIDHVFETGTAAMSANPRMEKPYASAESVARSNINAFMCAPLRIRGKIERAIYLDAVDEKEKFSEDDLTLLALIAQQVSLYLENVGLFEELHREKITLEEENLRLRKLEARECDFSQIIGASRAMQEALGRAQKAASARSTVLLTGQSGTGKELLAKAIHYNSDRADKPFITVNCAAIAEQLIESELFGHVKGAFTGAEKERKGQFEAAHGGTILLDEIGDMPLEAQAEVLRVLETGEVKRVGASETLSVDVRVIASTNKNLEEEMKAGRFRSDLFYRLNVYPVELPSLRDRKEDILPLLNHYLRMYAGQMNKKISGFSKEAVSLLRNYVWPGNVRELKNAVERMVLDVSDKEVIDESDLPLPLRRAAVGVEKYKRVGRLPDAVAELEKEMIVEALNRFQGNKTKTAKFLGVSRAGLQKMLKRYGLA
jgi:Nif-specific regulatory protein